VSTNRMARHSCLCASVHRNRGDCYTVSPSERGWVVVILVTEDSDDTRELMKLLLQHQGHDVDTAANGLEAVQATTQRVPDVILMDLFMPVMDGLAATRALRTIPETREVPIIAVSGHVEDKTWAARAKSAGCNECLVKPVDLEALTALLRRFIPRAGSSKMQS